MLESPDEIQIAAEPENKKTIQLSMEYLKRREKEVYRSGKFSFNFLNEELIPLCLTFAMKPYSTFYEKFDETIQRLCQGGFCPDRLVKPLPQSIFYNHRNMENDKVPPLVLSLSDLWIGFVACSIPLTSAVIVFVAEVLTSKTKKVIQLLGDLLVAYIVIKSFFKAKFRKH